MPYDLILEVLEKVSLVVLAGGTGLFLLSKKRLTLTVVPLYLGIMLVFEILAWVALRSGPTNHINVFLFPLIGLTNLILITRLYATHFIPWLARYQQRIYVIGITLLSINGISFLFTDSYKIYGNLLINFLIVIYGLLYFKRVWEKTGRLDKTLLWSNFVIISFFSIEIVFSLVFTFLISQSINWVGPLWTFRALMLELFYFSLIYFGWKTGSKVK